MAEADPGLAFGVVGGRGGDVSEAMGAYGCGAGPGLCPIAPFPAGPDFRVPVQEGGGSPGLVREAGPDSGAVVDAVAAVGGGGGRGAVGGRGEDFIGDFVGERGRGGGRGSVAAFIFGAAQGGRGQRSGRGGPGLSGARPALSRGFRPPLHRGRAGHGDRAGRAAGGAGPPRQRPAHGPEGEGLFRRGPGAVVIGGLKRAGAGGGVRPAMAQFVAGGPVRRPLVDRVPDPRRLECGGARGARPRARPDVRPAREAGPAHPQGRARG